MALLTAAAPGERVLDGCASPGGKTIAMASRMGDRGRVVATDLRGRRVELLARTVAEAGAKGVSVVRADVTAALPFGCVFDCVLLDAPCSGLGTLRRDPDIRWKRAEADLVPLAATQLAMLDRVATVIKPGGRLVYSTCSSEPDENELVVRDFLLEHPAFRRAPVEAVPPSLKRFLTSQGDFRTFPFRDQLEAFFGAMLVKTKDLR